MGVSEGQAGGLYQVKGERGAGGGGRPRPLPLEPEETQLWEQNLRRCVRSPLCGPAPFPLGDQTQNRPCPAATAPVVTLGRTPQAQLPLSSHPRLDVCSCQGNENITREALTQLK